MPCTDNPSAGRIANLRPTLTIKSPAFNAARPKVAGIDLMDAGIKAAMEAAWTKGAFAEQNIEVFKVAGAYVIDENLIFDDALRVVANRDDVYSDEEITKAVLAIKNLSANQLLAHMKGPGIVAKRRAVGNYGHYMLYRLPLTALGKHLFGN